MTRDPAFEFSLFDGRGQRKYLSATETMRFMREADTRPRAVQLFCLTIAYTGCRISEALELTPRRLDPTMGVIVLRTLKRRKLTYRAVPVPATLMRELIIFSLGRGKDDRLWPWCRTTGWTRIKEVMAAAKIDGAQASPKGLRHGLCMALADRNLPHPMIQKWAGHASPRTTSIYLQAAQEEERAFAERLWRDYAKR